MKRHWKNFLCTVLCCWGSFADAHVYYGQTILYKKELPDLTAYGNVDLTDVRVDGDAKFFGSTLAVKGTFKNLDVSGYAFLRLTRVDGVATVHGSLDAEQSEFQQVTVNGSASIKNSLLKAMLLRGNKLELYDSVVEVLTVEWHPETNWGKEPEVRLNGESRVGSVVFVGAQGKISKSKKSLVGAVENVKK